MIPTPLVTIGMPVYNEGRFIARSLEALVAQDYPRLELIISDNASTDDTGKIARDFASRYDWVRYHRLDENRGPAANFAYVLDQARGDYFMWAAGHDLWSSNYVSACVAMLSAHPGAVLAFGSCSWIDDEDKPFARESGWTDTRGLDVVARYFSVFWGNMHPILGVMRIAGIRACPLINTVGADLNILTRLALKGDFVHAVEASWQRREFRKEQSYADKLARYKSRDYGLATGVIDRIFPLARLPIELLKGVWSSRQPFALRLAISGLLLPTMLVKYFSARRR